MNNAALLAYSGSACKELEECNNIYNTITYINYRQAKQAEIEKMLDAAIKSKDPEALRKAISEVYNYYSSAKSMAKLVDLY